MVGEFNENNPMVPDQDSNDNIQSCEVVGNKTDMAKITIGSIGSIIAYVKGLLNQVAKIINATYVADALVVVDGGNTTSSFKTDLGSSVNDFYNEMEIVFTGGSNTGQTRRISDYVGATKVITVATAFSSIPSGDDAIQIISRVAEAAAGGGDATSGNQNTIINKLKGIPASGVIANLNVLTEQDLISEVTITTVTEVANILIDYASWYSDVNITGTGATLAIRVYIDDSDGTLREVTNLGDIITEGISGTGKVKVDPFIIERNFKVTVQSSIAPVGGVGTNLIKYHYVKYDRE